MGRKMSSPFALSIVYGKIGSVFYTTKDDRYVTVVAGYYKKKVKTERLVVVGGTKDKPTATRITKVTILT
jgi:hypothetical protein